MVVSIAGWVGPLAGVMAARRLFPAPMTLAVNRSVPVGLKLGALTTDKSLCRANPLRAWG